jgi:hypothetical protein
MADAELVRNDPELRRDAGAVVLDEDVGALQQATQHVLPVRGPQVERDRSLAGVDREEGALEPDAKVVAAVGRLDLDDVGAEQTEVVRAERACVGVCQVDDANALEGTRHSSRLALMDSSVRPSLSTGFPSAFTVSKP